ncbi:MAG: nucleotidyltransferase family protein [Prevotella sp.]|nr:nucleotidyltransferase family protein [Prevotella sp.]
MNRKSEKQFFELIQSAVWQRQPDETMFDGATQWTEIVNSLEEHAMLGLVADTIMSLPKHILPQEETCQRIRRYVGSLVREHYKHDRAISEIVCRLENEKIVCVLLKGQALSDLYPMKNMRSIGDIDLYVGTDNYTKAMRMINEYCGVKAVDVYATPDNIHGTAEVQSPQWMRGVEFEIHYRAADTAVQSINEDYNKWMHERMMQGPHRVVNIGGYAVKTPGAEWGAVYLFEHLLKHLRYEGVGFRQFVDWLLYLRAEQIDEQRLKEYLQRFKILDAWQVLGGVLVWQLGLPEAQFPLWNKRKARHSQGRNLRYITDSANLGQGTAQSKGYYDMAASWRRTIRAATYYARFTMFEYRLFPSDTLQRQFHRLVGKIK